MFKHTTVVVLKEEDESVKNKLKVWLGAYDSPIANYRYYACMCTCIINFLSYGGPLCQRFFHIYASSDLTAALLD